MDCYLPDFKYAQNDLAKRFSEAKDYPEICVQAITQMIEQTGENCYDENGILQNGVIIRHLILLHILKILWKLLAIIKEKFPQAQVSLMAQYTPCGRVSEFEEINRAVTKRELEKVEKYMLELEIDGFVQERISKGIQYIPNFSNKVVV